MVATRLLLVGYSGWYGCAISEVSPLPRAVAYPCRPGGRTYETTHLAGRSDSLVGVVVGWARRRGEPRWHAATALRWDLHVGRSGGRHSELRAGPAARAQRQAAAPRAGGGRPQRESDGSVGNAACGVCRVQRPVALRPGHRGN